MSTAFTADQIYKACGYADDKRTSAGMKAGLLRNVTNNWPLVYQALEEFKMTDPLIQLGVIATIYIETGLWRPIREMGGDAYLNRMYDTRKDLGNTPEKDGDGATFAGEGFVHLTGRANHKKYGEMLGIDMIANPHADMDPLVAAKVLCLYFQEAGVTKACLAKDWRATRKRVNGGYNGWDDFIACVNKLSAYLG